VISARQRRYAAPAPRPTADNPGVYSENHPKRLQMLRRASARGHFPHLTGSAAEQRRPAGTPQNRIRAIAADANWQWPCRRLHEHGPQDRHRNPQNPAGPASAKIPAVPFAKAQRQGSKRSRRGGD